MEKEDKVTVSLDEYKEKLGLPADSLPSPRPMEDRIERLEMETLTHLSDLSDLMVELAKNVKQLEDRVEVLEDVIRFYEGEK